MTVTMRTARELSGSTTGPAQTDSDVPAVEFPSGDDLAFSRATDFYSIDELLSDSERAIRDRVRAWVDTEVSPIASDYWEAARFPVELLPGYAQLGIAGGSLAGDGCPGLSYLAEGMIAAELARGDGSIATLNAVHSGLAMTTIGMLGSAEQRARYLPRMAACEVLGAFALTEPQHGSDVVALETRARREGDEWVLDGQKRWIGNGTVAGIVVVGQRALHLRDPDLRGSGPRPTTRRIALTAIYLGHWLMVPPAALLSVTVRVGPLRFARTRDG